VVANTGKILNPAAPDKNDGVLLKVMTDAGDVSGTLETVGKADTGNLTECGVRLFGSHGTNSGANAAALRALLQNRGIGLVFDLFPALSDQLVNSGHESFSLTKIKFLFLYKENPLQPLGRSIFHTKIA
jgi:hypothetical protein